MCRGREQRVEGPRGTELEEDEARGGGWTASPPRYRATACDSGGFGRSCELASAEVVALARESCRWSLPGSGVEGQSATLAKLF